jgi:hypothetical protein
MITLIKVGVDASQSGQINIGDAVSIVGNSVSIVAAVCAVVPGGQPLALGLATVGKALAVAGIGLSALDVNYPLGGPPFAPARKIDPAVNLKYRSAVTWLPRDPLAIDLDGDGIETLANGTQPVLFDHNGDGIKTGTGWLTGDDAWLVLDRDGNGTIDSGKELFGVDTLINVTTTVTNADGTTQQVTTTRNATTGFEALSGQDSNHDRVFDANDASFTAMRLWQDANSDGISQAEELSTLSSQGIISISLSPDATTTDLGNGNSITGRATVTRSTGTTTELDAVSVAGDSAANLNLADNPFFREFPPIPYGDEVLALPNMRGSGQVRDLREAMSITGSGASVALRGSVASFSALTTRDAQMAAMGDLLRAWARTSGQLDEQADGGYVRALEGIVTRTETQPTRDVEWVRYRGLANRNDTYWLMSYDLPEGYDVRNSYQQRPTELGIQLLKRLNVLDVFNGRTFLDVEIRREVSKGHAQQVGADVVGPATIEAHQLLVPRIDVEQMRLLDEAYDALVQSVYGALGKLCTKHRRLCSVPIEEVS